VHPLGRYWWCEKFQLNFRHEDKTKEKEKPKWTFKDKIEFETWSNWLKQDQKNIKKPESDQINLIPNITNITKMEKVRKHTTNGGAERITPGRFSHHNHVHRPLNYPEEEESTGEEELENEYEEENKEMTRRRRPIEKRGGDFTSSRRQTPRPEPAEPVEPSKPAERKFWWVPAKIYRQRVFQAKRITSMCLDFLVR